MEQFIKIAAINNQIEAQYLESVLADRSIPYTMQSYHDSAYNGLFQAHLGWGVIRAPESYKEEILLILEDIRKT